MKALGTLLMLLTSKLTLSMTRLIYMLGALLSPICWAQGTGKISDIMVPMKTVKTNKSSRKRRHRRVVGRSEGMELDAGCGTLSVQQRGRG